MLQDRHGVIDYGEEGAGPTIVFVPGSWVIMSAWRGVIEALDGRFRTVTTSLPGYGGTGNAGRKPMHHWTSRQRLSKLSFVALVVLFTSSDIPLAGLVCLDVALCGLRRSELHFIPVQLA